jgi:hypothetical protein
MRDDLQILDGQLSISKCVFAVFAQCWDSCHWEMEILDEHLVLPFRSEEVGSDAHCHDDRQADEDAVSALSCQCRHAVLYYAFGERAAHTLAPFRGICS